MRFNAICAVAAAILLLTGCNKKAETQAEVQRDVTKAAAEGQRDVADARADVQEANADADKQVADAIADRDEKDVASEARDANETADKGKSKIMIAQAEADHKVAIEKCEALTGPAQKECKDNADQELDQAKETAKVNR
jgi:uncharacterized lipoprotein NlpE involved in copper resistance